MEVISRFTDRDTVPPNVTMISNDIWYTLKQPCPQNPRITVSCEGMLSILSCVVVPKKHQVEVPNISVRVETNRSLETFLKAVIPLPRKVLYAFMSTLKIRQIYHSLPCE